MIKLHHLNKSRSKRIIWLLEELELDYEIITYMRNSETLKAPEDLRQIHPLGKSPIIEIDGLVIAESGAIIETLIEKFDHGRLKPKLGTPSYYQYLYWLHFTEGSAMFPLLLQFFSKKEDAELSFLPLYAQSEVNNILLYLDQHLENNNYLVDNQLTAADIMISFFIEVVVSAKLTSDFKNIPPYLEHLESYKAYQKANEIEKRLNTK